MSDEPQLDEELLDALALVYARAALDRLCRELQQETDDAPTASDLVAAGAS